MSLMLAPIHHWLYRKIRLLESREEAIHSVFQKKYGREAKKVARKVRVKYGYPQKERPLEELIGESPIHGWLQGEIERAESREAALIVSFLEKFGKEAEEMIRKAFSSHASETGRRARKEHKNTTKDAPASYQLLLNYLLDGMPCDHVTEVVESMEEGIAWKHLACLHQHNWDLAGAPFQLMCKLNSIWVEEFGRALGWGISHERKRTIANGNSYCEDSYQLQERNQEET